MCSNKWFFVFTVAFLCSELHPRATANTLQHLSAIDTSYADNIMGQLSSSNFESAPVMDDIQSEDIETPTTRAVTAAQVTPIVTSLLNSMSTTLAPLLGPLAPLANVIGPMINSSFTQLLTNAINGLLGAANRKALGQINGYNSYVINIPGQGSFLLMTKHSLRAANSSPSQDLVQSSIVNAVGAISSDQAAVNTFSDSLDIPNASAMPITNTLLDSLKYTGQVANAPVRPLSIVPKRKVVRKKQQAFLVPLNLVQAANGNLNTFASSRSNNPLTDFELDVY